MTARFPDEEAGVAFVRSGESELIRNYGDPEREYRAATEGVALRDRGHRGQWRFTGKQPLEMLKGIVSGRMPDLPVEQELGILAGAVTYHTVLTPKGKILADLRLWREPSRQGDGEVVRADVPQGAMKPLEEHLGKLLPPRLARLEDVGADVGMLSVVGPAASRVVSGAVTGLRLQKGELDGMEEDELRIVGEAGGDEIVVIRSGQLAVPAFDIVAERDVLGSILTLVTDAGGERIGLDVWDTLRVEAARPAFGMELGTGVIPMEAGLEERAIDHAKGCYTGQEVIVRIRDRGHVNRRLHRLDLSGEAPVPAPGTPVYDDSGKVVGEITTAVDSPRRGKLALAFVRREVGTGNTVHVGAPDGPGARVGVAAAG